jgi:DNA-binding LacI/PurR family transcriptional regulator
VLIDNISGGFKAVNHLTESGHKRIAFIAGDINHPSISDRHQGYKNALEKAGIEYNKDLIVLDENYPARENGYNAARKIITKHNKITGIFACNDAMAIGVIQYLKEKKIRIPEDISIVGFDDVEADLSLDPTLSTIHVPKIEMGIEGMKLMTEILKNKSITRKKILVPVELVIRKSTKKHN